VPSCTIALQTLTRLGQAFEACLRIQFHGVLNMSMRWHLLARDSRSRLEGLSESKGLR
jgi:hypothetical protein